MIPYEYVTSYTYNSKGQVLSIDGPLAGNSDLTTFTYDATTGNVLTVTQPAIGTTTYSEYDAAGQVGRITDSNGNAVTYTYDGKGRIKTVTNQSDSGTTTINYNTAGDVSSILAANGVSYTFTYEATNGRLTRITDTAGNYIQYAYDTQGNRTEQSHFNSVNEKHFWLRFNYQGTSFPGKLWKVTNPDNSYTEYTYNTGGNLYSVKDPANKTTSYAYDPFRSLVTVTQPGSLQTGYEYDTQGNLVSVTDPASHTTFYDKDDMGRLVSAISPDEGTTLYNYDPAGNLVFKRDARNNTTNYTYDGAYRLTQVQFSDPNQNIIYTYDQGTNGKGQLTGMTDPSGSYTFSYDPKGNLITEQKSISGVPYTTQYTYDLADIPTGMTYPEGRTVTYELNNIGKVSRVTTVKNGNNRTLAENIGYRSFGPLNALSYGNGTALNKGLDQLFQTTDIDAGAVQSLDYTIGPAGNVTGITNNLDSNRNQTFTHQLHKKLI